MQMIPAGAGLVTTIDLLSQASLLLHLVELSGPKHCAGSGPALSMMHDPVVISMPINAQANLLVGVAQNALARQCSCHLRLAEGWPFLLCVLCGFAV